MTKQLPTNPFDNLILDKDEQMIEHALENNEYDDVADLDTTKMVLKDAADRYSDLHNSKPITVRVNQLALIKLKAKAKAKNIPYQTLLGVLINEYVEGRAGLHI